MPPKTIRFLRPALALAGALFLLVTPGPAAKDEPAVQAIIEMHSVFFTTKEPAEVRFSLWNAGDTEVRSLPSPPLTKYFELVDADGSRLEPAAGIALDGPHAASLPPGGHYGLAFDLSKLFPQLRTPGTYRLTWKSGGIASNQVVMKIVRPYDPARQYQATLETSMGDIVISFFPRQAPRAVKNFIDLAYSGFYDGTRFYHVEPGALIAGGDRAGDGTGTPGTTIPFERTDVEFLAGTVAMKRAGSPPTNGSAFFILAAPRPGYNGRYTAFAQVVKGLDVVQSLSRVPSTGAQAEPAFRPLSEVLLKRVVISETPATEQGAPAPGGSSPGQSVS
jgi:cyclophilin family peptidyl-prolyl cis-trans isomerase